MNQVHRAALDEALRELRADERAWLDERLAEYADLLAYLHDH